MSDASGEELGRLPERQEIAVLQAALAETVECLIYIESYGPKENESIGGRITANIIQRAEDALVRTPTNALNKAQALAALDSPTDLYGTDRDSDTMSVHERTDLRR